MKVESIKKHWTERSIKDYLFRIAADFITQLEKRMESIPVSQDELAKKLGVTKGRVSQVLNHPGNITLGKIIEYARTLGTKVSIVAYEDNDPENRRGPINPEVFRICWEKCGKPRDLWAFEEINMNEQVFANLNSASVYVGSDKASINVLFLPLQSKSEFIGNFYNIPGYVVGKKVASLSENFQKRDEISLPN
jgi:transcriptional regulator with XRE-family HTH domain